MKWVVKKSNLSGTIAIPPSKSHTIRALLIASLADGVSAIRSPLCKGDGASAIGAARSLGASVEMCGTDLRVTGIRDDYSRGDDLFDMGNSGTGTNLFTAAAALGSRSRTFDGDSSLRSRPVKPLLEALRQLGATYQCLSPSADLPFTITGPLRGGAATVSGVSSQFLSSLLLACPLLENDTDITVVNLHERPYVELTLWWLHKQGIRLDHDGNLTRFHLYGKQRYGAFDINVPADFSSATFAAVAAAATGSSITLTGLDFSDPQGDKGVFDVIRSCGARVTIASGSTDVCGERLTGAIIDLNAMPDALPALAILATAAVGDTHFVNVAQARIKETDRISVMAQEIVKLGGHALEKPDGLVVRGGALRGAAVSGHGDHRVVMALALAGMIAEGETVIDTAEAAEVTYPSFVEDFRRLGADIRVV